MVKWEARTTLAVACLAGVSACSETAPTTDEPESGSQESAFEWRRVSDEMGVRDEQHGSLVVTMPGGTRGVLGLDAHSDASGREYAVELGASANREGVLVETLRAVPVEVVPNDQAVSERRYRELAHLADPDLLAYRMELLYAKNPTPVRRRSALPSPVRQKIAEAPAERLHALIALEPRPALNPSAEAERRRLDEGLSDDAVVALRRELLETYASEVHASQLPALEAVRGAGGRVIERFWLGNIVAVEIEARALERLAARPDVRRIDLDEAGGLEGVDGSAVMRGVQVDSYTSAGFNGERPNSTKHDFGDIALAFIDVGFEDDLPAYLDTSVGPSRIKQMWDCTTGPLCYWLDDIVVDPTLRHGTWVSALAVGDLADGQDPTVTTAAARAARSGVCPECSAILIKHSDTGGSYDVSAFIRSLQVAANMQVDGANISHKVGTGDCEGVSAVSGAVNDLVRVADVFFTKSAGNDGHSDPNACTVTSPGGATYAFTVGGTLNGDLVESGNYTTVRTGPIYDGSARGGEPYMFGTRSVIATVAPAGRQLVPDAVTPPYFTACCGTSGAAPQLLGAFADFRDWWLATGVASFVNHAPNSVAPLLLMGDRQREGVGTPATSGFDELFGTGRFRARLFTSAGMDAPWAWGSGSLSLSHGTTVTRLINGGNVLPAAVDRLVVVMWWPEPFQGDGGFGGADITMDIDTTCGTYGSQQDWSFDTKKRIVRIGNVANRCWQINFTGHTISPNPWDANAQRRRVYYAYYWEDEARDDADGPPSDVQ